MSSFLSSKLPKLAKTLPSKTPPFPTFRLAKSALLTETDPEKLLTLFTQCSQFPTFTRHRPIFHAVSRKLTRSNRLDLLDSLIQSQTHLNSSEGFCIRLITLYSNAKMPHKAFDLLRDAIDNNRFQVTEKFVSALLSGFLKNDQFDRVYKVFDEIPVKPGKVSCTLVLKAYVKEGKMEKARDFVRGMEMPEIECYNVLLGGYLGLRDWKEFDGVVKEIAGKGLEGNVVTYNYRLSRLCKAKECVRARKLLDEMVLKGLVVGSVSYNTVIDGFCRIGDFESAKKVLERMVGDGRVKPCSFTYFTMVRSMVNEGEFEAALGVSKEILKRKWIPPFEAMEGLVKGLVKESRVEDAKEIVNEMKKKLKGNAVESWGKIEAALAL